MDVEWHAHCPQGDYKAPGGSRASGDVVPADNDVPVLQMGGGGGSGGAAPPMTWGLDAEDPAGLPDLRIEPRSSYRLKVAGPSGRLTIRYRSGFWTSSSYRNTHTLLGSNTTL